ncbi:hypothetical protein OZX68_03360 [Streptococcaceae bacterium ESL0729]|nr:hypothetical protein OZX68_03360 [Streptococcaceae bacterium ESL0729]
MATKRKKYLNDDVPASYQMFLRENEYEPDYYSLEEYEDALDYLFNNSYSQYVLNQGVTFDRKSRLIRGIHYTLESLNDFYRQSDAEYIKHSLPSQLDLKMRDLNGIKSLDDSKSGGVEAAVINVVNNPRIMGNFTTALGMQLDLTSEEYDFYIKSKGKAITQEAFDFYEYTNNTQTKRKTKSNDFEDLGLDYSDPNFASNNGLFVDKNKSIFDYESFLKGDFGDGFENIFGSFFTD